MVPPRSASPSLLLGGLILALLGAALVCLLRSRPASEDSQTPAPSSAAAPSSPAIAAPPPAEAPESASPDASPAEQPLPAATTRLEIESISTSAEAAAVHRALTTALLARLEELATEHRRDRIKVALQELADRYYLLDRVVTLRELDRPGPGSIDPADEERVERLFTLWQENLDLSLTVDQLFRERGLLPDEHVSQSLRKWIAPAP